MNWKPYPEEIPKVKDFNCGYSESLLVYIKDKDFVMEAIWSSRHDMFVTVDRNFLHPDEYNITNFVYQTEITRP